MVSIIICTYNREKFIGRCLSSLANQTAYSDFFEIIIIDNNSSDGSPSLVKEFIKNNEILNCYYFLEKRQGLSYARNRGIAESKGEILAFLDDDAIACNDYVSRLIEDFGQSAYLVGGGKILPKWESSRPQWMGRFLLPLVSVIDLGEKTKEFKSGKYPIGANMFLKRSVVESVGGFNTQLGRIGKNMLGGEEKDLFNRIRARGIQIRYYPDIFVHHIIPEERTTKKFIKNQALGIGSSERARTNVRFRNYLSRIILELLKWNATLLISLYYLASFNYSKAMMLMQFRYWVSCGLLNLKKI